MTRRSARLSEALYHQPHDAQAAYALGVILSLALRLAPPPDARRELENLQR